MAKEKKKSTFWSDFKAFITKGNVLDMAVGVVVGGAFGKITTSLVNNIIMPPIGVLIGGMNFSELKWVLVEAVAEVPATETTAAIPAVAEVAISYGLFIQTIIDFLLIALCVFAAVRWVRAIERRLENLKKKEEVVEAVVEEPVAPPEPSEEVLLLREIRDSLKKAE